jgi:hypothetical protein
LSDREIDYVLDLGSDRVTRVQKHILLTIARHVTARHGTANLALSELAAEVLLTERHLARVFAKLGEVIEYIPGLGSGNFSQFRFVELSQTVTQRRPKDDISGTAIKEENLNQDQKQTPLDPPFSKGGTGKRLITVRQVRELRCQIDDAERDGFPRLAAIERACRKMLFPLDAAIELFAAAGHQETSEDLRTLIEEKPRKPPGKASAA